MKHARTGVAPLPQGTKSPGRLVAVSGPGCLPKALGPYAFPLQPLMGLIRQRVVRRGLPGKRGWRGRRWH